MYKLQGAEVRVFVTASAVSQREKSGCVRPAGEFVCVPPLHMSCHSLADTVWIHPAAADGKSVTEHDACG